MSNTTKAWKLFRLRKDGTLGPLFVDRELVIRPETVYTARQDIRPKTLAYRPGFHCIKHRWAPHIKMRLHNGERRVWCRVVIADYYRDKRPLTQGGMWYVAQNLMITKVYDKE
jgi:hypothetical protein